MRNDPLRDLDARLMDRPFDYSTEGFQQAAAIREGIKHDLAELQRNIKVGSPLWEQRAAAVRLPGSKYAAWLDGQSTSAEEDAAVIGEARVKSLSRIPTNAVDDNQLARLRDALAKADPAQRKAQFLHAAQEYADGKNPAAHEPLLRAIFTAPTIWGVEPLVDENTLKEAEATLILPEVGPYIWRAKMAKRLAEGLRQAIGELPPVRILPKVGRDNATP